MADEPTDGIVIISDTDAGNPGADAGNPIEAGSGNSHTAADGTIIIDPGSVPGAEPASGDSSDTGKRKRGRPRGSRNTGPGKKPQALSVSGIESILLSSHAMLAGLTKVAELEMEQEECHRMAEGIANVARHYDLPVTAKAVDWTNLIMVMGEIYGSRMMAYGMRRRMERQGPAPGPAARPQATPEARPNGKTTTVRIPGIGDVSMPDERLN